MRNMIAVCLSWMAGFGLMGLSCAGCGHHGAAAATRPAAVAGLRGPMALESVNAECWPPVGWQLTPMKSGLTYVHELWVSPTGDTAYGVIGIRLPFPFGPKLVLWRFMEEMKQSEGEGKLLSRRESGGKLIFEAEGGRYHLRGIVVAKGFSAWVVYAGALRGRPENAAELSLAYLARDLTVFPIRRQ